MTRRPPRSTQSRSSAASDVYKRQEIDFGGVAKGYATGAVCGLLRDRGVKSGLVNFGGGGGGIGLRSDRKPWVVGIKSPRGDPEDLLGELKVSNAYVSSSCLLYTSDAADALLCVDLGGRRIIK